MKMPYDYYEFLKKNIENEEFKETTERVRENLWSESIDFQIMQNWATTEERLLYRYYIYLRYS